MDATLLKLMGELRAARTEDSRHAASHRLREWYRRESRGADLSFSSAMTVLTARLADLISSADSNDKLSGITAILELTEEPVPDNEVSEDPGLSAEHRAITPFSLTASPDEDSALLGAPSGRSHPDV